MIISRTPLRISFVGGGTDFPDYYKRNYGAVISTAIDKYVYVVVNPRFDDLIRLGYSKAELVETVAEIEHGVIREALKLTGVEKAIEVIYFADVQIGKAGLGLGSSSALAVGVLNALYTHKGQSVDTETLAKQACQIELEILKRPMGKQDQYIAAYGGFNYIQFNPDESVEVKPVNLDQDNLAALNKNLICFHSGFEPKADGVLSEQKSKIKDNLSYLDGMVKLTREFQLALLQKNFGKLGELLHQNWLYKKQLASNMTNPAIDEYYEKALQAGAVGGKILGSGGGGFLLCHCEQPKHKNLRQALFGLRELPFRFEAEGSKVILQC